MFVGLVVVSLVGKKQMSLHGKTIFRCLIFHNASPIPCFVRRNAIYIFIAMGYGGGKCIYRNHL
jgi:hypothetical protein